METMHQQPGRIQLLATVAHELRNPVAAIQCAVRVLKAPGQASCVLEQARALIDRQVLRIARISDDLLSAGYMATGKLDLCKEHIDLREVVNGAVEACRPQFEAGNHAVALRLPPEPVGIEADPIRIMQVLTNLLDNAAKYSGRQGTIVVSIEDSRGEAAVHIVDDGVGISAQLLPHVFEMFVRADQASAHSPRGMGIGLSVVKRIVELHQGTVDAFSAGPGLGSTFTIRLPKAV